MKKTQTFGKAWYIHKGLAVSGLGPTPVEVAEIHVGVEMKQRDERNYENEMELNGRVQGLKTWSQNKNINLQEFKEIMEMTLRFLRYVQSKAQGYIV